MKIAVISPLATVAPHFETELEIAQRHLDAGDRVEMLACIGGLTCCDFNTTHEPDQCGSCAGRRRAGIALVDRRVRLIAIGARPNVDKLPEQVLGSLEALQAYRVEGFDIGLAIVSSLVSICRDPQPNLKSYRGLIERLFSAAMSTYRQAQDYCRMNRPDRIYVFNGRFAATRAVLRACQAQGVDCWIHERGCDVNHFQIFENRLPHDIEYTQRRMRAAWEAAEQKPERDSIARSWFTDRVERVERSWHSFVKDQSRGRLPGDWDPELRNIAIFSSSEDEFVSIGDSWRNTLYANQTEGLHRIVRDLPQLDPRIKLSVRIHPNMKNVHNESTRSLLRLAGPRVSIIPPDDRTDSYELLRQSDAIVTFGSSIGIEAVYWDRPSVLLGPCFYRGFPGAYQPASHEDAMHLLSRELSPATDKTGALMYGYWFQTHGEKFKYFEATGLFEGRFRGQIVHDHGNQPTLHRIANRIKHWVRKRAA